MGDSPKKELTNGRTYAPTRLYNNTGDTKWRKRKIGSILTSRQQKNLLDMSAT